MADFNSIKKRFDDYTDNKSSVWKSHFTWNGLDGNFPKNSISIVNFFKKTGEKVILKKNSVNNLWKEIERLSKNYITWIMQNNTYNDIEQTDLRDFFIGAMGEYFFYNLLTDLHTLVVKNQLSGKLNRVDFDKVMPRLSDEKDMGVDFTCMSSINDTACPSVIQVKFWNPYINNQLIYSMVSNMFTDAMLNDYINMNDSHNIYVCWLGDMDKVSKQLKSYPKLYNRIIFIDGKTLDDNINQKNPLFWTRLIDKFNEISNM